MERFNAAAWALAALGLLALGGCEDAPWHLDPFGRFDPLATNGRDGGGAPLDYPTLMRVGAAARAGGDYANALSLYRRAASLEPSRAAPFVATGNTLIEMGEVDEAIIAFNSALARDAHDPEGLRGLAKAYLRTARPELAGQPLGVAFEATPDDPKLLQLIGVADDFLGQHGEAQARYRRGLELAPGDPGLTLNLALSLALTGSYDEAISRIKPLAAGAAGTARERQTLALIYGLKGDQKAAAELARIDLEASAVKHNLAYYETLRRLSPEARGEAIRALGTSTPTPGPS